MVSSNGSGEAGPGRAGSGPGRSATRSRTVSPALTTRDVAGDHGDITAFPRPSDEHAGEPQAPLVGPSGRARGGAHRRAGGPSRDAPQEHGHARPRPG